MIERNFKNKPKVEINDFDKSVKIIWSIVGGHLYPYSQNMPSPIGAIVSNSNEGKDLLFSFENHESKDFLTFYLSSSKTYKLNISDKVHFMFDDETILSFEIIEAARESRYDGFNQIKVQITQTELEFFASKILSKWRIEYFQKKISVISVAKNFYWYNKENYNLVVQNLVKEYKELVEQYIENHIALFDRTSIINEISNVAEECHVYLMIDTTNNFHKIGISNNPKYREKTLQSDKPTIELLCSKSFPNRKTAEILERTLHKVYEYKRIRGEWFSLDHTEVIDVMMILK